MPASEPYWAKTRVFAEYGSDAGVGSTSEFRLHPFHQRSHTPAGGALGVQGQLLLGVGHAGDVQMRPRNIVRDEMAQERPALERVAIAAGGVHDVGAIAFDM